MLDAAEEAMGFIAGLHVEAIHHDRMLALALVRCIEVVGEAANGLSPELQEAHPRVVPRPNSIRRVMAGDIDRGMDLDHRRTTCRRASRTKNVTSNAAICGTDEHTTSLDDRLESPMLPEGRRACAGAQGSWHAPWSRQARTWPSPPSR
jgi:hypothetical protein